MKGLNATTELTLPINPSGVVMLYLYKETQHKDETETFHQQHMKLLFTKAKHGHHAFL